MQEQKLVKRVKDIQRLGAAIERARAQQGRPCVVVSAPPGFGKSVLAQQYAEDHQGALVLDCYGPKEDWPDTSVAQTVLIDEPFCAKDKGLPQVLKGQVFVYLCMKESDMDRVPDAPDPMLRIHLEIGKWSKAEEDPENTSAMGTTEEDPENTSAMGTTAQGMSEMLH